MPTSKRAARKKSRVEEYSASGGSKKIPSRAPLSSSGSSTDRLLGTTSKSSSSSSVSGSSGEMPLRLPKLRRNKSKQGGLGDADSGSVASMASLASNASSGSLRTVESFTGANYAYVISKVKDLPKLHRAVWKGNMTKVKSITKGIRKKDLNATDKAKRTALHLACAKGEGDIVHHLCSLKATVNVMDSEGATPMHKLLESGQSGSLQYLLDCGGDSNLADKLGRAPLHVVAKMGDVDAATLLLERDARIDAVEMNGMTALHIGTLSGHRDLVSSLINDGADINTRDGQGRTCLMIAASEGSADLLRLLIDNKADPEINDNNMFKALDYAVTRNHQDCARLIEDHEKVMEKERLLDQQRTRRGSLIDPVIINTTYGGPSSGAPALDLLGDTPSKSKDVDTHSQASVSQQDSWPASDYEDDLLTAKDEKKQTNKMNLKAALEKAKSASPERSDAVVPKTFEQPSLSSKLDDGAVDTPSTSKVHTHHYQLTTTSLKVGEGVSPSTQEINEDSEWDSEESDPDDYFCVPKYPTVMDAKEYNAAKLQKLKEEQEIEKAAKETKESLGSHLEMVPEKKAPFQTTKSEEDFIAAIERAEEEVSDIDEPQDGDFTQRQTELFDFDSENSDEEEEKQLDRPLMSASRPPLYPLTSNTPPKLPVSPLTRSVKATKDSAPTTQPKLTDELLQNDKQGGISQEASTEGMLTIDEELSDFDSEDEDYVEDVPDFGGYVPSASDALTTPSRSEIIGMRSNSVPTINVEKNDGLEASPPQAATLLGTADDAIKVMGSDSMIKEQEAARSSGNHQENSSNEDDVLFDSDDDIDQLLAKADELSSSEEFKATPAAMNETTSPFATHVSEEHKEDVPVINDESSKPSVTSANAKTPDLVDIIPEYEDSDWDSDDEEEDDENEEEMGTALAWLTSSSLADPFAVSRRPQTGMKSNPTSKSAPTVPAIGDTNDVSTNMGKSPLKDKMSDVVDESRDSDLEVVSEMSLNKTTDEPAEQSTTPLLASPARSALTSPVRLGSPKLKPLSANSSLQKLPPLTISPSHSGLLTSPMSKQEGLTPVTKESPPSQQSTPSSEIESESDWERELKAKKQDGIHNIDSGFDTLHSQDSALTTQQMEVTLEGVSKLPGSPPGSMGHSTGKDTEKVKESNADTESKAQKRDEEAKQRLFEKENELLLVLKSRKCATETSPKPLEATKTTTAESETAQEGLPVGKTRVQRMRDLWESGNASMQTTNIDTVQPATPFDSNSNGCIPTLANFSPAVGPEDRRSDQPSLLPEQSSDNLLDTEESLEQLLGIPCETGQVPKSVSNRSSGSFQLTTTSEGSTDILFPAVLPESSSEVFTFKRGGVQQHKASTESGFEAVPEDQLRGFDVVKALKFETVPEESDVSALEESHKTAALEERAQSQEDEPSEHSEQTPVVDESRDNAISPEISELLEVLSELEDKDEEETEVKEKVLVLDTNQLEIPPEIQNTAENAQMPTSPQEPTPKHSPILSRNTATINETSQVKKPLPVLESQVKMDTLLMSSTPPPLAVAGVTQKKATPGQTLNVADKQSSIAPPESKSLPASLATTNVMSTTITTKPTSSFSSGFKVGGARMSASDSQLGVGPSRRGLRSYRDSGDDDDLFTSTTESDVSPVRSPRVLTPLGQTSVLTSSQLHSSSLQLHHLTHTPGMSGRHTSGRMDSNQPLLGEHSAVSELSSTSPVDAQSSQDVLSDVSRLSDDVPLSHLMRLNQSVGGGGAVSLLNSAQVTHLQESLREACRGMEQSQRSKQASDHAKRRVEARLEEYQKKHDEVVGVKLRLENSKLELELQGRELKYQLEQSREAHKSSEAVNNQLREQLDKMEVRLSREIETRQATELRCREMEITLRGLQIANQQLQEETTDLSAQLQSEKEGKLVQESLYKEQIKMFQNLQKEAKKAQDQKTDFVSKLQSANSNKQDLQSQLNEMVRANSQLKLELSTECQKNEDVMSRLESELENAKERLQEKLERQTEAEDSLLESRQQFEAHLSELKGKAELLSTTLDKEVSQRMNTQDETTRLQARLDQANTELQELMRKSAETERMLSQQLEDARRDIVLKDKDVATLKEANHQLNIRVENTESKNLMVENEFRSSQTILLERANQISGLQRECDQKDMRIASFENILHVEKDAIGKLEVQLSVANEKVLGLQSEGAQLRQQVEFSQHRVEEKESSATQAQQRFDTMLQSMKEERDKSATQLEQKHSTLLEQLLSLKDDFAHKEAELKTALLGQEKLQGEVKELQASTMELAETLRATEEAYHELEEEKTEVNNLISVLEDKVYALEENITSMEKENGVLETKTTGLERTLSQTQDMKQLVLGEKEALTEQKSQLETDVRSLQGQLTTMGAEANTQRDREKELHTKLEHLAEIRSTLESRLSEQQSEIAQLQTKTEKLKFSLGKSQREAEEARTLWENEVKTKSKLGMKIMEMEKSKTDANSCVENEKRRTRKALVLKKGAEMKLEAFHERLAKMQGEVGSLRTQLKVSKRRVQQLEMTESQLPEMKAEFNREQASYQSEVEGMNKLLETTRDQLRREVELRHKAEQTITFSKHELDASNTRVSLAVANSQSKQKEVLKLEKVNRKLKEEVRALHEHIAVSTVSKTDMDAYKKAVEDKARKDLSKKLEEVNAHLEQQSQAQDALAKLRSSTESEWREKYEKTNEDMRSRLAQAAADVEAMAVEAQRFKELYEAELHRAEKLSSRLQKAKEDAKESRMKLSFERNRTQHMLNATQSAAAKLSPPTPSHNHSFTTSTPFRHTATTLTADHSPTDELLSSVRAELDKSIARHLDSATVPTTTRATRLTYHGGSSSRTNGSNPHSSMKYSHLDSIKRNYRI